MIGQLGNGAGCQYFHRTQRYTDEVAWANYLSDFKSSIIDRMTTYLRNPPKFVQLFIFQGVPHSWPHGALICSHLQWRRDSAGRKNKDSHAQTTVDFILAPKPSIYECRCYVPSCWLSRLYFVTRTYICDMQKAAYKHHEIILALEKESPFLQTVLKKKIHFIILISDKLTMGLTEVYSWLQIARKLCHEALAFYHININDNKWLFKLPES